MKALARLQAYNRDFAQRCNVARWFGALFHVGVQTHLIEDAKAVHVAIAGKAHSASVHADEALKVIMAAQCPRSPGGPAITECEAKRFVPLIGHAKEAAHDACELATP